MPLILKAAFLFHFLVYIILRSQRMLPSWANRLLLYLQSGKGQGERNWDS